MPSSLMMSDFAGLDLANEFRVDEIEARKFRRRGCRRRRVCRARADGSQTDRARAMISRSLMMMSENAPSIRRSALRTLPPLSAGWASRCRMISLSAVVWKMEPLRSSSSRRTSALIRLPLCAIAIWPRKQSTTNGCAFFSVLEPVVE